MFLHAWVIAAVAAPAASADMRTLLERALDEPTRITLENVQLADALQLITEQTGVKIVMTAGVMNLVPHGGETVIHQVEIANIPLRQGLTELFGPLGMTFVVRNDHVEIRPRGALLCLGRPPTWPELDLLTQLAAIEPGTDAEALAKLRDVLGDRVEKGELLAN